MTSCFPSAAKLARLVKGILPETLVVLGGIHPTFVYEHCLRNMPNVDFVVLGEGEYTMLELTQAYLNGPDNYEGICGLAFRQDGQIYRTPPRERIKNLDSLPFPNWELSLTPPQTIMQYAFKTHSSGTKRVATILASRGCPYSCHFCSTSLYWGHFYRARSPQNIVDEIEFLQDKYQINVVNFCDDLFTIPRTRTVGFCQELLQRGLRIEWTCSTRVDAVDLELLQLMKESGCSTIFYGLESLSDAALKRINKKTSRAQIEAAISATTKAGIKVVEAFILGLLGETITDLQEKIDFVRRTSPETLYRPNFTILKLFTNTEFHTNPDKYGIHPYEPPSESFYENLNVQALDHTDCGIYPRDILGVKLEILKAYHPLFWVEIPAPTVSEG